jgi:P4 family phage/plasmid primase-like protien
MGRLALAERFVDELWEEMQKEEMQEKQARAGGASPSPSPKKAKLQIDFLGLAKEFVKTNPLYYDRAKLWWRWDPETKRWERTDETDILASIVIEQGVTEALARRIKDMLFEALKILARRNKPKDLPSHFLAFKNCLYDLQANRCIEPSPEYFITSTIPWQIGDGEETPTIDRLFEEWVGADNKQLLYEITTYCLLPSYPIHRLFILLGAGRNGKSSFLRLLKKFLGAQNCVSSDLDKLTSNIFEPARLYKKLACFIGETNFSTLQRTSILKQLTGEDLLSGQFKYKNAFDFTNFAKIIIATNTLPQVSDKTDGFFRRTLIVDFPNQFKASKDIISQIPDQEFENLARKSICILKELLEKGEFTGEGTVEGKRKKYEDLSNP